MKKVFKDIVCLVFFFISLSFFFLTPVLALEGTAGGPCMPPHDAPTVGSYHGGDQNLQTFTAQSGRKITRLCMATRLSNGKIDHSSFYQNYDSECYQVSGLNSSKVTIKRVSETYLVPSWQTGPEAGKCAPLEHLDLFLSAEVSSASPSPTANTSSPSPTPTMNPSSSPSSKPVKVSTTISSPTSTEEDDDTIVVKTTDNVLGQETDHESSASGQASSPAERSDWNWWWLSGLFFPLILAIIWWRRRKE